MKIQLLLLLLFSLILLLKVINSQYANFFQYQNEVCSAPTFGIGFTFLINECTELYGYEGYKSVWLFSASEIEVGSIDIIEFSSNKECEYNINPIKKYPTYSNGTCIPALDYLTFNLMSLNGSFIGNKNYAQYYYFNSNLPQYPTDSIIYEHYLSNPKDTCASNTYSHSVTISNNLFLTIARDNGNGSQSSDGFSEYSYNYTCINNQPYIDTCHYIRETHSFDCNSNNVYSDCTQTSGNVGVFCYQ